MAELTWRNVDAPNLDTRGLALAGATVSDAFANFGKMLQARQDKAEQDATDSYIAGGLRLTDPGKLAEYIQSSQAGSGVHLKDALAALQAQRAQLISTASANEDLQNKQALASTGQAGSDYLAALEKGDHATADKIASEQYAKDPQTWGRVAYGYARDGAPIFDSAQTRAQTATRDAQNNAHLLRADANDARRTGILAQQAADEHATFAQNQADRLAARSAFLAGQQFANTVDPKYNPDDALHQLHTSKLWTNAKTSEEQKALDTGFTQAYGIRTTPTQDALNAGGDLRVSPGVPAWMVPNATPSARQLLATAAAASAQGTAGKNGMVSTANATNIPLGISTRLASFGDKQYGMPDLVAYAQKTGMHVDQQDLQKVLTESGVSPNELMATMQQVGAYNTPLMSLKGLGVDLAVGVPTLGLGAIPTEYARQTSGRDALLQAAKDFAKARVHGDPVRAQAALATSTAPIDTTMADLKLAQEQAQREVGAFGKARPETVQRVLQLSQRLQQYGAPPTMPVVAP